MATATKNVPETRTAEQLPVNNDDDHILVGRVRDLFQQARAHRKPRLEKWMRSHKVVNGQTMIRNFPNWLPRPEVNEVYPIISALIGWMTDQRAGLEVTPQAPAGTPFYQHYTNLAQDLQTALTAQWINGSWDTQIERTLWDAAMYGTGILKTTWDHAAVGGKGDVALSRVDPFAFYPDPSANDLTDGNYYIEARKMSLQELDRRFPGSAKQVTDSGETVDEQPSSTNGSKAPMANPGSISPITAATTPTGYTNSSGTTHTRTALPAYGRPGKNRLGNGAWDDTTGITVLECWIREHTHASTAWTDRTTTLDGWRVVIVAGNTLLMNEPATSLWRHGNHPYSRTVMHETGEFWGPALVEKLTPLQIAINRLLAAFQSNIELTGNPILQNTPRSGVARTQIPPKPGQQINPTQLDQVGYLQPPTVSPQMFQLIEFYVREMERISGLSAITRGAIPGGRNAEGTIDSIQESAFVRVRMALRNLEHCLRDAGTIAAALTAEYYDQPRVVSLVGESGTQTSIALQQNHFYTPDPSDPDGQLPMRFNLLIRANSTLPTSRKQRAAEADMLYAMGAIDDQAVLDAHEWPNRQQITQRVEQKKAAGMFEPPGKRQRTKRQT